MNEMEALYDEYRRLRDELNGRTLDEIGAFELRNYRRRFESLHRRNLELQDSTRRSDVDIEELRQVLNLGDRMWNELGETLKPVIEVIDIKMALGKEVAEERRRAKELREENAKTLKTLVNQNKRFKKTVNSISDPEARAIFEDKLKVDEETIQRLKDLDELYARRIKELGERLRVIALGGKVPELESTRKDTEGLSEEEAREREAQAQAEADEPVVETNLEEENEEENTEGKGLPGVSFEGVDSVTPIRTDADLTQGLEGTPAQTEETPTKGEEELPIPAFAGAAAPAAAETEVPVPALTPEGTAPTSTEEELPVPSLGGTTPTAGTETEIPVPALTPEGTVPEPTDAPTDASTDAPVETSTPTEEPVHRATKKQASTKLWSKINKVLSAVKSFLYLTLGAAVAVHTGLIASELKGEKVEQDTNTETVEESENYTDLPEETNTEEEQKNETPSETQDTSNTQTQDTSTAQAQETSNVPTQTAEVTPTSSVEPTPAAPTVTVGPEDVVLSPGESVYDSTTGVEVGYTGVSAQDTSTGPVSQENRQLEHVDESTVVVRPEALQPDQTPASTELPRTGQEIPEEEARKNMTEGEQQNLDQAIEDVDWEAFFNDGPTL